jgi:hypothetical protein
MERRKTMNTTALSIAGQMRDAWNACNSVLGCSVQRTDFAIYRLETASHRHCGQRLRCHLWMVALDFSSQLSCVTWAGWEFCVQYQYSERAPKKNRKQLVVYSKLILLQFHFSKQKISSFSVCAGIGSLFVHLSVGLFLMLSAYMIHDTNWKFEQADWKTRWHNITMHVGYWTYIQLLNVLTIWPALRDVQITS